MIIRTGFKKISNLNLVSEQQRTFFHTELPDLGLVSFSLSVQVEQCYSTQMRLSLSHYSFFFWPLNAITR